MSSRLGLPPSLLALVFLTSSLILTSAIQPREIKSLPNPIILAPNERVRFWADDYFAGYNLTFDLNGRFAKKIRALETSPFNTKSALDSSKSFQTSDGKLITAYLHADLKVTVVPYEDGKLSTSFQVPIAKAKICYDLEFLSQDVIVVDCNMENSQKTFTFISLKTKKVIKTANNDELFKRHSRRKLRAANGFNGADLISLISSDDTLKNKTAWQINFIKFDNNNNIDTVTKVSADNVDELADFELSDVLAVSSTELLITGANYLYLAKPDDDNFLGNLVLYPLNDKENANAFTTLQSSGPLLSTLVTTDSTAYEILRSQEGGYLEVADIFVDSIYRLAGNVQIEYAQLTQDFAIFVTTGARPSLYIFKRGDTKANDIFYVNYISDFQFDEPVKLLAHYDKNVLFWITDSGVQTLGIQEVWLEIINDKPSEPKTIPLRVCSEGNCVTQNIELVSLDQDDYHIYQLNKNELKFVKTYNETLEIAFDDLFAAPHINYELNSAEGDRLPVPDYIEIGLSVGNMPTEFVSIDYDEENKKFRLHIQEEGKDTLDLYLCNIANKDSKDPNNPPYLNCDKKASDTISGKVRKVYAEDPVMDIIEIVNEKNLRNAAVGTKKLSKGLISYYYDCDVIYKSYDNHVESNTFCAKGNNITINTNSSYVGVDHILLEDSFKPKQILTHPAFPGLLFISNNTAISIINSEFYLGPHYGHDIATINTISVPNDPDFRFVVTSSHIVIFLPKNDSISEFEITNPLDIIFNKQYMLHGSKLIVNEKTIAYSQTTDLIYTIIGIPFVDDVYFLLVLEPNGIGNANFKYVFNTTYVKDLSKYTLSVTNLDSETDLVLHGASGGIKGFIVGKEAKITFTGNYMADSELFAERSFVITAKNPFTEEVSTKDAKIYFINTQRSIKPLDGDADLKMELSFRNDTKILFKESDLFSGPAFRWSINKEVETDNIDLIPRVHSNEILGSSAIPNNITDISYNNRRITRGKIFLLEDEGKKIHTYESADFPAPESKRQSPELHGLGGKKADLNNKCYQVESDPNQIYIAALCYDDAKSAAFIDVININDNSLNYQLITPTENTRTIYKVVSNYLFYTTRDSYNAIYVYKISQDKANLKVDLLRIVTRDDLTIGRRDNITDMDGFMLRSGQTGVFVATGSTGFNYLFIENDNIKISSYPNFLSLFANDHLQAYNNAPVFHALALLRRAATDSSETFTLILSSKNAFSYKLSVVTDRQGNINNVQVLEGYIQYQNYRWLEMVAATADTVVLMGFIPGAGPNGFGPGPLHYFFYDQKAVPTLNTSYPLYDAFQVLPAEGQFTLYEKPLHLLIRRRGEELLYIRNKLNFNGITGGLKEYRIEDTFSLETPASRVSSSYVDLIAANDFWSNSIRIPVQNYGNILPGVSPGKIILFVFGGLGLAFIIAAVLIKVFSNKEKKQLKDTDFARPGETTQQTGETDASQYFKIED